MESLAWAAHIEGGGGELLPYLSYKGMFNIERVMIFVPLWSKIGYRSASIAPPPPPLISTIPEVSSPQCSFKFLLYLMLLCSTTEKEFVIITCFFSMSETDDSLL